jgi:penicillin-binding protein 2
MSLHQTQISRRAMIFGGVQLLALTTLAGRLGYLQFIKRSEYKTLAENNRIKLQLMPPARGRIVDKNGVELASNERSFELYADVTSLKRKEVKPFLGRIDAIIPLGEENIAALLAGIKGVAFPQPLLLKEHLSWEEVVKIEMHLPELPGVYVHVGEKRFYPLGQEVAHLVGYVGAVAPEEVVDDQPVLRLPDFRIGKSGVEKMFDERLRGTAGLKQVEVNVHGLAVRELSTRKSIAGENISLTIDERLQHFTSERIKEESASVVVMDVATGNVLTMASMPAFDPNIFSVSIPTDYWATLHDNERLPLMNKAVAGQYPPGSTFKMMTGLAGLEKGVITPSSRVNCPGHFYLGNHKFNCWKEGGHGSVSIHEALAGSCDTFFYSVAQRLGINPIAETARQFGFGTDLNLGYPNEKSGIVPDEEWKMKRFNQPWQAGDTVNVGIGQGYVIATPLQMCVMTSRLLSGLAVKPRLVADGEAQFAPLAVRTEYLAVIKGGMDAVVNSPMGTAYGKRIAEAGKEMGGKTGTSQVRKITVRGQDQSQLPWNLRHHAFFIGYAPIGAPKYAVSVAVEHGGGGSAAAAPIARDVLLKAQELQV